METQMIARLHRNFEEAAYQQDKVEYWLARDLQRLLGYDEWRNFLKVIDKAKVSCKKSGQNIFHHFVDISKMVKLGSDEDVRGLLAKSGIKLELPPEEDIKIIRTQSES